MDLFKHHILKTMGQPVSTADAAVSILSRLYSRTPLDNQHCLERTIDDMPIIDPRYYLGAGKLDQEIMVLGERMANRIAQTEPLAEIIHNRVFPPVHNETTSQQSVYGDFASKYTVTDWHRIYKLLWYYQSVN